MCEHEAIYTYVWSDKRRREVLFKNLRHSGKKYNKRSTGKAGRGHIPNRVDIEQRPAIVEQKARLGDWELDTVLGKQGAGSVIISIAHPNTPCLPKSTYVRSSTLPVRQQQHPIKASAYQVFLIGRACRNAVASEPDDGE